MIPLQEYLNSDNTFKEKVGDFLTQTVITVKEDTPIMENIDHTLKHNVMRVLVFNKGNKVIGILYGRDIFSFIRIIPVEGSAS